MLSQEVLHKIRHLEIQTRRMLSGSMSGDNTVSQKGFGIEFDQLRDYQQGDDVRCIDWRATARMNKTMVKQYLDDRNRSIHLCVDISPSVFYGSGYYRKIDSIAQIASALALVADYGKDQVSLTLFDTGIVRHIPSGRGRAHVHEIMKTLFEAAEQPQRDVQSLTHVDYGFLAHHAATAMKRSSLVCILSDFIGCDDMSALAHMGARHDVVALRVLDPLEVSFPSVGYMAMADMEHAVSGLFNCGMRNTDAVNRILEDRLAIQARQFKKQRIESIDIQAQSDVLGPMIRFFRRRMSY